MAGILFSCVNDLDAIKKVTFKNDTPDEIAVNLHVVFSEDGYAQAELFAAIAETFNGKEHVTYIKDSLRVNFFNEKGKIVSTLSAKEGQINYEKSFILVKDSVRLYNYENKQTLATDALYWNQKDSSIYSLSAVTIQSPKGIVYGNGMKTKQDFRKFEFLKPHGRMEIEKELEIE